jgi:hypothetical protein
MRYFTIAASLLLILLAAVNLGAQKLYTWTDENGLLHITDQPPPNTKGVEDVQVIRYKEKSQQEIEAVERKKEILRRRLDKEEQIEKVRRAEIRAAEAEREAQKSLQQTREKYESDQEYIRRLTSTKNKRKQFRKRVLQLKAASEAALAGAIEDVEQADEAVRKMEAEKVRRLED